MSGRFFTKQKCARCSGLLAAGRIQSMHDDPTLCMGCKEAETRRSDYLEAVEAESAAGRKGEISRDKLFPFIAHEGEKSSFDAFLN